MDIFFIYRFYTASWIFNSSLYFFHDIVKSSPLAVIGSSHVADLSLVTLYPLAHASGGQVTSEN
jgi:hypothetical protein